MSGRIPEDSHMMAGSGKVHKELVLARCPEG